MRIISFIALFLFTVEYNSNYSMDFDDYLVKAFVNDILIQEDNRVQVPHFERNFDSEEGDILSFVVRNSCTYLGLRGNVNSNEHTFRFGKELCPLMTEKSGITLSIVTDSKNLGFYDINQYTTVTFLLTIPKVINIEFTEEIITSGIDIDIIPKKLKNNCLKIKFFTLPDKGIFTNNNETINNITEYSDFNFHYTPRENHKVDYITFMLTYSSKTENGSAIILIGDEGFKCIYNGDISFSVPQCNECKEGYNFLYTDQSKCLVNTTRGHYYLDPITEMFKECDNECVECDITSNNCTKCTNLYYYDNNNKLTCIAEDECPEEYPILLEKQCIVKNVDSIKTNIKDSAIPFIESNQDNLTIINGNNYTFEFYPSSYNLSSDNSIKLGNCESVLRDIYNIPSNEELYISQLIYPSQSKLSSNNQYVVYNSKGEELDLGLCNKTHITITNPINEEMEGVNFTLAKQLQDEGINIFNSSEPFFNDKCISYSLDGKDLTVKDRREKILQNIPLCEEGCQVQNINYTLSSIDCECTPKKEGFNSVIESNEIISTLTDLINNYNFYIFLCANNIRTIQLLNYGNLIIGSLFAIIVIISLFFLFCQMKYLYGFTNKFFANPASSSTIRLYSLKSKEEIQNSESMKTNDKEDISSQRDNNSFDIEEDELNELEFDDAIIKDKRNFCKYYFDLLCENQIILSTIFNSSIFYPLCLRLIMLLFTISAFLFFNELFFTEDYISNRLNSSSNFDIIYIFKNELSKSVYSSLMAMLISKIMIIVTSVKGKVFKLLQDKDNPNYRKDMYNVIRSIKTRIFILFTIIFIFLFLFWYFLAIFCRLYMNSQIFWLQATLISICFNFIIPIISCLLFGSFKYCGIRYRRPCLFKIGNFLLELL